MRHNINMLPTADDLFLAVKARHLGAYLSFETGHNEVFKIYAHSVKNLRKLRFSVRGTLVPETHGGASPNTTQDITIIVSYTDGKSGTILIS